MSEAVKYEIRKAMESDVEYLAPRLREIDLREIAAVSGRGAKAALMTGLKMSDHCNTGTANGEPICMYGVSRLSALSDSGIVWLLATDELPKHAMKFGRECGIEVSKMLQGFRLIENWCHADNKITIRWLKWLGFKFEDAKPFGAKKELFHRFYMEAA